ncbi:MAG TPA: LysM peptidoglycan-binding domain-containing protein [Longilinea sp.]|nr:LysM peptidoglycan-binding domain-containing protein [Longilinea sp.]
MKRISWKTFIFGGIPILIIVGAIVAINYFARKPNFDNLLPLYASQVQVKLLSPGNSSTHPADSYIPIQVNSESSQPLDHVELWINGKLFESQQTGSVKTTQLLSQWRWQPGVEGSYSLMARAFDIGGHTGISNVAVIQVTKAEGYDQLITSQSGDTIASLAAQYNISMQDIEKENPSLGGSGINGGAQSSTNGIPPLANIDINKPIPPKTTIFIPHLIEPTITQDFSLGNLGNLSVGGTSSGGQPPSPTPTGQSLPLHGLPSPTPTEQNLPAPNQPTPMPASTQVTPNFFDKLAFQLGVSFTGNTKPPAAPTLDKVTGEWQEDYCHPWFDITRNSKDEDGFFVYRYSQGAPMMIRVATLPKLDPGYVGTSYHDFDKITGVYTYVVSAYNSAGESYSAPLTFDLSQCDYSGGQSASEVSTTGGVGIQNGYLTLPSSVDLAYLYVNINEGELIDRIPPGSSNFLSGSGYQFDLTNYLGSKIDQLQATDLDVEIQVWGWQNGQVNEVGSYSAKMHRAVLAICSQEGENQCQLGSGGTAWTSETFMPTNVPLENQYYNLSLSVSTAQKSEWQCLEVSNEPFTGPSYQDGYGIVLAYSVNVKGNGILDFPLSMFYNDNPPKTDFWNGCHLDNSYVQKMDYPAGTPFTLYIRAIPQDTQGNYEPPSNTVILHYQTSAEAAPSYPLASNLPSLYSVKILTDSYTPPVFVNYVNWGCVTVLNNADGYTAGENICPPKVDHSSHNWDVGGLLDYIFNEIANGIDDLSKLVDEAKGYLVSAIADIIPGCGDSCISVITSALDAGFTALTGLPPSLPNFDELSSEGISYVVDQVASETTGFDCDDICEKAVKDTLTSQLTDWIHEARIMQSEPSCLANDMVAMYYDVEPGWCLPPEVEVKPYPGGSNQPGAILVQITRNNNPAPSGDLSKQYFLDIQTSGTNTTRKGTYGNSCAYYANGYPVTDTHVLPDNTYQFYKDQEHGALYNKVRVPMPPLNPGESLVIPISLQPKGYDNTTSGYPPGMGCDGYSDFKYLFYKGTSAITAAEYCYVAENNTVVPCTNGGSDIFTTDNPQDPSDQWP